MNAIDRDALRTRVETALLNSRVSNLCELLGYIIRERVTVAPNPACSIAFFLSENIVHMLGFWEDACTNFFNAFVSRADAVAKAEADLLGPSRKCEPGQFNAVMGDFFAEISVVGELSKRGYSAFISIPRGRDKSYDYECLKNSVPTCMEFKNIRAPVTIMDAFDHLLKEKLRIYPALRCVRLVLTVYSDNTATDTQWEQIDNFLSSIADGRAVPHIHDLTLTGDVSVRVEVQKGTGTVMMTRSRRAGEVSPFVNVERFMSKVENTIKKALGQLCGCYKKQRVLAMNVMSPDATIPLEWISQIREVVHTESLGAVQCEIGFHYGYLSSQQR